MPQSSPFRRPVLLRALLGASALLPAAAMADCTTDATGLVVTCAGTSAAYSNQASGTQTTIQSGATVTGPLSVGANATVTNAGTVNASSGAVALQVGSGTPAANSTVTNNGTISGSAGSGAILAGDYTTVTNNGSLTATAGTPAISFGRGGTFINNAAATAAVTGNLAFGPSLGTDVSTIVNNNTSFGLSTPISTTGNTVFQNNGLFTGTLVQTATGGAVTIVNGTAGAMTGAFATGDVTNFTNNGTVTLNASSLFGSLRQQASSFTNNGTLSVGSTTTPAQLIVYGNYAQGANGVLNIALKSANGATAAAGTTFSQVYASGGTATLGGTLNIVPAAGFYPTGSTYNVVLADQGVTGTFATVTGGGLPFITFVPVGVITVNGSQQAYQVQALRTQTYAQALGAVASPNQIAVANGFQPLIATATATPTADAAALVGAVDLLTVQQAQVFFDTLAPTSYVGFATALRDQANLFGRQVQARLDDHHSEFDQRGWWLQVYNQLSRKRGLANDVRIPIAGVAAGYDLMGVNYVLGAAVGYSYAKVENAFNNLNGHNNAYQGSLYGALTSGRFKASGQIYYALGNIGSSKTIDIGTATRIATATARSHLFKASGQLSVDLGSSRLKLAPFAGVEYMNGGIRSFTEQGAGSANLSVGKLRANRTDVVGGFEATTKQGELRPYVRAAYRSALSGGSDGLVSAYLNGDPTTAFTVTGRPASKHEGDIDAGLNFVFEDQGLIFVGYQGTIRRDLSNHGVTAGLRIAF